ncbi:MAG: hypothetical protein ACK4SZ_06910 [Allosphingosinicella sp.]|uniref:hypothetical protein n=1 Tax=Allosphingosinicella sp. TaxID=2823234 RepID=UPI0039622CAA
MTTNADYDAVLQHWCVVPYRSPFDDADVIVARIAGDRKGRFADGRWMMTSVLLSSREDIRPGSIVQTLNSRYLLGERLETTADAPRPLR